MLGEPDSVIRLQKTSNAEEPQEFNKNLRKQLVGAIKTISFNQKT